MRRLLLLLVLVLLPTTQRATAQAEQVEKTESVCGLWPVPPDFSSHGETAAEDTGADPFSAEPEPKPGNRSRFKHIVPLLGPSPPFDVKAVLQSLGVSFRDGDLAFLSAHASGTRWLFVRVAADQFDLIDQLVGSIMGSNPALHGMVTWTLRRRAADGATEDLIKRSILCQSGHRAKFQRCVAGSEVEMEEVELTIGEDGVTLDVNTATSFHLDGRVIKASGQALIRSGDPEGILLHATRDKISGAGLEIILSGKRLDLPLMEGQPCDPQKLRARMIAGIAASIAALESPGAASARRSELFCLPGHLSGELLRNEGGSPSIGDGKAKPLVVELPHLGAGALVDARPGLRRMKITLDKDDAAWFAPESGLLYLHATETALSGVAGMADVPLDESSIQQVQLRFDSWEEKPERHDWVPRQLLVRSGQKASIFTEESGKSSESIEAEAWASGVHEASELNVSLASFDMGNETWSITTQARTLSDGASPVTLVSGRAGDTGGCMRHLTVSSTLRWHGWQELVRDPAKRAAAVRDIEAALKAAGK